MIKKYLDLDFNNFTEDVEIKTQPAPHDLLKEKPTALPYELAVFSWQKETMQKILLISEIKAV